MGTKYLIDTNIAIYLLNGSLNEKALRIIEPIINDTYYISVISKIELLDFAFSDKDILTDTRDFVNKGVIIPLSDDIVEQTISLRRKYRLKIPDAITAATAIVSEYTLLSRNDKDFVQVQELKYMNSF